MYIRGPETRRINQERAVFKQRIGALDDDFADAQPVYRVVFFGDMLLKKVVYFLDLAMHDKVGLFVEKTDGA